MPTRATILNWVFDGNHLEFFGQYARAREIQAELIAEEIVEIADDGINDLVGDKVNHENVQRSNLRVDARKWVAARLLPKRYGDRIQHTGDGGGPIRLGLEETLSTALMRGRDHEQRLSSDKD